MILYIVIFEFIISETKTTGEYTFWYQFSLINFQKIKFYYQVLYQIYSNYFIYDRNL
jgi:hypothetical protein